MCRVPGEEGNGVDRRAADSGSTRARGALLLVIGSLVAAEIGSSATAPWMSKGMPIALKGSLGQAFPLAMRRLQESAACQDLFGQFDAVGPEELTATLYYPARPGERPCREGAAAFTMVGSRVTYICDTFGKLSRSAAARVLIHEALHQAGLGERPHQPNGLTSSRINGMVRRRCEM
jgi:hypothetical protein